VITSFYVSFSIVIRSSYFSKSKQKHNSKLHHIPLYRWYLNEVFSLSVKSSNP